MLSGGNDSYFGSRYLHVLSITFDVGQFGAVLTIRVVTASTQSSQPADRMLQPAEYKRVYTTEGPANLIGLDWFGVENTPITDADTHTPHFRVSSLRRPPPEQSRFHRRDQIRRDPSFRGYCYIP